MKTITSYRHPGTSAAQEPDTQPGHYYVSACDDTHLWLMLGPFPDDHSAALAAVEEVRSFCYQHDGSGRAYFMAFGTVRYASTFTEKGKLNDRLPHLLKSAA